jgi:stress-induced-phosphoprotein 1
MSNQKAEGFKAEGNKYFSQGNYLEAIKWYTKAIEESPSHIYYSNRSACYTAINELQKAIEDADQCIKLDSKWAKGYYRRGNALALLHRHNEAFDALTRGNQLDPKDQGIKDKLLEVKSIVEENKIKAQKMNATPSVSAKLEGNEYYKKGLFPEAIECYTRSLALATDNQEKIDCLNNRAACQYQLRSFKQVIIDSTEVIDLDPNNVKALLKRGLSYESLEKIDQALEDMRKLQIISPGIQQVTAAITRLNRMQKMKEGCSW